jgi:hypothetical protein
MTSNANDVLKLLRQLRLICTSVLFVPVVVIFTAAVVFAMNANVGLQRHRLPGVLFLLYFLFALASPVIGCVSLYYLVTRRQELRFEPGSEELSLKRLVWTLSVVDIIAFGPWVMLYPLMILAAGGMR